MAIAQDAIPDEVIIDYSALDKPLREVLFEISSEAEITIAFQDEIIPGDSLINFSVRKQEVGVVLNYLLNRHRVTYKVIGDQIVLYKKRYDEETEVTISGYLRDLSSGEVLINAYVYKEDQTIGTETNEYGFYSLTLPPGEQHLYYTYLGYNTDILDLELKYDTIVNVDLDPNNRLREIVIIDQRIVKETPVDFKTPAAVHVLPIEKINSTLPIAGEPDIMRLAYTMPGVTTGSDGFGGMSVRGGSTNQNLILLDGTPVYNAHHLFGLFSIFNANVIKSAKLFKGPFPSNYSGRLSSVMDIRTRDGNTNKLAGDISLGLLTAKASLEGPIKKGRSSFLISARRTTVDAWIDALNNLYNKDPLKNRDTGIKFYDINAKLNFSLGDKSKLHLGYYNGSDNFRNDVTTENIDQTLTDLDGTRWDSGNQLASVRWSSNLSPKVFLSSTVYSSRYKFASFVQDRVELLDNGSFLTTDFNAGFYQTSIKDLGARLDLVFFVNNRHKIKTGINLIRHQFEPRFIFATDEDNISPLSEPLERSDLENMDEGQLNLTGKEFEFYIEDEITLGKHTSFNLGLNQLVISTGNTVYIPQPRILFTTGSDKYRMKLSYGRMGQYLHSLTNTGLGVPIDIWLPSTDRLIPEQAWIASWGHHFLLKDQSMLSAEFYYKKMKNITRYGSGILRLSESFNWEDNVPQGTGESYGMETSFSKKLGKTQLQASYTLSWNNRSFETINNGDPFRFRYDRRHVLNLGLIHKLNENIEFSANWEYGSGTPITIPSTQSYNYIDENNELTRVRVFSELNNAELPAYHRLDLGFNLFSDYKWGKSQLTLGVYNIYDRLNPLYVEEIINSDLVSSFEQFYLFKIMPTFSYTLSF